MSGHDIRALRTRLGLSQSQLARVLGVHPLSVSRWERGQVTPEGTVMQLLTAIDERTRDRQLSDDERKRVATAVATGAAVAGLLVLLAVLFSQN